MREYALMMLVTVISIRLFWIGPICKAIEKSKTIIANLSFTKEENIIGTDTQENR